MSRAAQEVQRQINEMRKRRPQNRSPRVVAHDIESPDTDVIDELATQTAGDTSPSQGGDVATATTRRRSTARKRTRPPARSARTASKAKRAAKRTKPARVSTPSTSTGKWSGEGLPDPTSMRLAKGGVAAGDGSTIRLQFANGYGVTLKVGGDDPVAARDNLVTWMRKRLGADRT